MLGDGFAGPAGVCVWSAGGAGSGTVESGLGAGGACWDGVVLSWLAAVDELEVAAVGDCWPGGCSADPRTPRGKHPKPRETTRIAARVIILSKARRECLNFTPCRVAGALTF